MTLSVSRQSRRLERLAEEGVAQANLLVHQECRDAFEALRPFFSRPDASVQLEQFADHISRSSPVNVAQVKQLSPFRYPGGKTWLVPLAKRWLRASEQKPDVLLEPFAGGAMIGLSIAAEGLANSVKLVEKDDEVSAVWATILHGSDRDVEKLITLISSFIVEEDSVRQVISSNPRLTYKKAFRTIVKNRCQRGGIMAPGAGLVKNGENGKGLSSRWYPETLVKRISAIRSLRPVVSFEQGDAFDAIKAHPNATMFIDPPYTAAGKKAGRRLYTHNEVDHALLFEYVSTYAADAMLTYDDTMEVRSLAQRHGFLTDDVLMKSGHHAVMKELVILKR